ncbi:MAG: hypothetical protein ABJA77_12455 [Variovorax sp.]
MRIAHEVGLEILGKTLNLQYITTPARAKAVHQYVFVVWSINGFFPFPRRRCAFEPGRRAA